MLRRGSKLAGAVGASIIVLSAAPAAIAQAPASETAPPLAASGLGDIVVTAQRRSENSQRAAIPLDVVPTERLQNAGITTPTTLNAAAPSVVVQKAGGANTIYYVRGVGNFTVNAYADPAVAFNLDGVYLGRPTSTVGSFFDLERIEVLKGPQGTLYGRNATGGAINVIPVQPKLGEFSGHVSGALGSFDATDFEGAVNIPVGEQSAFRIAARIVDGDGYYDDGTNDEVGQGVRAQFLTHINESLTARFAADYSHQGGNGPGFSFVGAYGFAPGAPATPTSIPSYTYTPSNLDPYSGMQSAAGKAYASKLVIGGAFINPAPSLAPYVDNSYWGVQGEFTLDSGLGTFTFIPAYRSADIDNVFNGPNFAGGIVGETDKQFSSELRLQGKRVGPVDWLLGAYYFDEDLTGHYNFSQYQINSFQIFDTGTTSKAAFGQLTFNVTDDFRLVGAARYTEDTKRLVSDVKTLVEICSNAPPPAGPGCFANTSGSVPAVPLFTNLAVRPAAPGPANSVAFGTAGNRIFYTQFNANTERDFSRTTYRAAAEWDVGPSSLMYVSYETGFRSGGFSQAFGYETYNPEFLTAFTIGSKNRFFDNRLQLNAEIFNWDYRDQQVSHFGFDTNGNTALFTENIGQSTIKGADVDVNALLTEDTLVRASVQYLDNKFDSFVYTVPRGGTNLPPVTGCPYTNATQGALLVYSINCSGLVGFNAPEWSANLGIDQTLHLGAYELVLTADARYRGNRLTGFERLPQMFSGADTTLDLLARFSPTADDWYIAGYVRNVTDETTQVATQFSGTTGSTIDAIYGAPRTYGVRAGLKF